MSVEWRDVLGYEGLYQVSSDGQVRSVDRTVLQFSAKADKVVPLRRQGKLMTQAPRTMGRPGVCLSRYGKCITYCVHSLVCSAFHGPKPYGMQVCHNDGDVTNNRADNLRWDTPKANQRDRLLHGTDKRGEEVGTSKFSAPQIAQILAGLPLHDAKTQFGISKSQYYRVKRRESWAHVVLSDAQQPKEAA